ncbi:hypothetical protein FA951_12730 [Dermacoccus nishinomiyaensis]|uniref:hypothetical protein n=1 Tax=Dermacoccus TaxID=57495 RepID=UPI0010ACFD04|nr:hypothetical protein [Dermacoccus nishinomiyaensis]TJZ95100.1 hypothetical protein FA951_12730 [Dermacoccus nishinomiyaensis]
MSDSEPRRRRRPRRASAPATRTVDGQTRVATSRDGEVAADGAAAPASATPDADWSRWWSRDDDAPGPRSAQDQWYLDQRPPHWG